jgi:Ser/Thr protein kinase RdoA (MazF antagonist)
MPQSLKSFRTPSEQDAKFILRRTLHKEAQTIRRFPTGLANYVYDVETQEGERLVVRLARSDLGVFFEGALHWHARLTEIGVPLPALYYSSTNPTENGFPVMIMERLPGQDLYFVYPTLTSEQKKTLATDRSDPKERRNPAAWQRLWLCNSGKRPVIVAEMD